jgi:hypothetical protein
LKGVKKTSGQRARRLNDLNLSYFRGGGPSLSSAILWAGELCEKVTGKPLTSDYFLNYLEKKFGALYGF